MKIKVGEFFFFFFQAEDGIRDVAVTGVQTCALPISLQGAGALTASLLKRGGATLGLIDQPRCGRAPPRLHPGIGPKSAGSAGSSSGAQFHDRHIAERLYSRQVILCEPGLATPSGLPVASQRVERAEQSCAAQPCHAFRSQNDSGSPSGTVHVPPSTSSTASMLAKFRPTIAGSSVMMPAVLVRAHEEPAEPPE